MATRKYFDVVHCQVCRLYHFNWCFGSAQQKTEGNFHTATTFVFTPTQKQCFREMQMDQECLAARRRLVLAQWWVEACDDP